MSSKRFDPNARKTEKMIPIEARPDLSVIAFDGNGPSIVGSGPVDYECPYCGRLLSKGFDLSSDHNIKTDSAEGIVLQCPTCQGLSHFPPNVVPKHMS